MPSVRCLCLLLAMCLSVGLALESSRVEDGFETFPNVPGSRFKLYTIRLSWAEALSLCQGDGGGSHLVVINSQEEADVVKDMFARITDQNIGQIYVGINDIVQEGNWVTIQGGLVSTSGYNKWEPNEPGPGAGQSWGPTDENCGAVGRTSMYEDVACDHLYPFICEKPDV